MTTGRTIRGVALAIGASLPLAVAAAAQEAPEAEERARIVEALIADGFISWGEIERDRDRDVWRVVEATDEEQREYVVKVDDAFRVERQEAD